MAEKCFLCGNMIEPGADGAYPETCPHCGAPQGLARRARDLSDRLYDRALREMQAHALTAAEKDLRFALSLDKSSVDARNLLGLCLFERGEYVGALSAWIVSKNFSPEDNRADYYLNELRGAGRMDRIDQQIKKYNQAIAYLGEGSRDLAKIQLKRITGQKTGILEAYQLLGLIYISDNEPENAKKVLRRAEKIDEGNTVTVRYLEEAEEMLHAEEREKGQRKKARVVSFQDGNDAVTVPKHPFRDAFENSRATVINILAGLVIGVLFSAFLIVPAVREEARNEASNSVVGANQRAQNSQTNITQLESEVKSLEDELAKYTGQDDLKDSYEHVVAAKNAVDASDLAAAETQLSTVNRDLLGDNAKALYDSVSSAVNAEKLSTAYESGKTAYDSGDYEAAAASFSSVTGMDESYDNGQALYRLGQTYEKLGQNDNALNCYNRIGELFPDTALAGRAARRASRLGS